MHALMILISFFFFHFHVCPRTMDMVHFKVLWFKVKSLLILCHERVLVCVLIFNSLIITIQISTQSRISYLHTLPLACL